MLRPAYIGLRLECVNHAICRRMRQTEITRDVRRLNEAALLPRRKFAQEISQRGINVGFVKRYPVAAEIAQALDDPPREALKKPDRVLVQESAPGLKPQ